MPIFHFIPPEMIPIRSIIALYLFMSFLLTAYMVLHMYYVDNKANDKKRGIARVKRLVAEGRFRQTPLYSFAEIATKKTLGTVRLSYFPIDSKERKKCAIICPGGGYAHCVTVAEGYTIAARMNELGYPAFVLEYRTGLNCSKAAPMHDLARAVRYITENSEMLQVDPTDYALIGFSAGGNLAGIYGSEQYGYRYYKTAKPGALILGYPWTNVNHWMDHPYWNLWEGLMGVYFSERCNLFMFRTGMTRENRESLCVQNWITGTYPPTYMYAGGEDVLVRASAHTDVLEKKLREFHVPYQYEKFFSVPHGIGLGMGTEAEGWLDKAVEFWQAAIRSGEENKEAFEQKE